MRRIFLLLLTSICLTIVNAGSLSKRYTSFLTEKGILYFVRPMHMPKCEGNQTRYGLTFDITYLDNDDDSVSFTTTVITALPMSLDSVLIVTAQGNIKVNTDKIYSEPYKSNYLNRLRFYLKWRDLKLLYGLVIPYVIVYGDDLRFSFSRKEWMSEREIINRIIKIIELNK